MPTLVGKTVGTDSHIRFFWLFQTGSTIASQYDGGAAFGWQGNGTIDFTLIQVTEGAEALPFRRAGGSIGEELRLCQRYYEKSYSLDVAPGTITPVGESIWSGNNSNNSHTFYFRTRKRTVPSSTVYNPSTGASGEGRDVDGAASRLVTSSLLGESCSSFQFNVQASANYRMIGHFTADAEL